ncbi:MAG: UDP-N-acetylglucosamine--N-acetylmuramyl-(pentapeptide) pyrophosphoryl-undecaprenol N-acetylglucosamine transferase [Treponema sp.]|nr:UDP-N-acetylglucosamine--N-acetylmuramyl-(pentapeptide) pyrophosphoryl-undecaprenol N-acetylglucosamine transferase [Treponema sp.]
MKHANKTITAAFAGGGTGGHIYPGLAVAGELRQLAEQNGKKIRICWIGCSSGMDRSLVEKNIDSRGMKSADEFYGIPAGKLRRYFSFRNFLDLFKILAGFFTSLVVLIKIKPVVLFSKGGFVSVPPCAAAKLLHIPVYTHECDFTPGLATRINGKSAEHILLSYKETELYLKTGCRRKVIVTGNPVRSVFYEASADRGMKFLGIEQKEKPVLLVLGGSSGARQINELIAENLDWLCERYIVVHQTGMQNADRSDVLHADYRPFGFIYAEMPDVIAAADVVLSRAGANSIWECAVLAKPLVLVPLCGSGTRGDQEDNARYFENHGAAVVLSRSNATSEKMKQALENLLSAEIRSHLSDACGKLAGGTRPAEKIARLLYTEIKG